MITKRKGVVNLSTVGVVEMRDNYGELVPTLLFIRGGWQSAPKTTSPMPLSSKNWFRLVKIA
jgi:hypothetical protein